jgi:Molydopterin dinucleotide binding domain
VFRQIATSLPYERHDLTGAVEIYFAQTFARVATPLLERPPGYIDDWEFFWGLARRMGTPMRMKQALFGVAHDQIPGESFDLDPAKTTSTQEIVRWMCGLGDLSYDELLANPRGIARDRESVVAAVPDDGSRLDLCPTILPPNPPHCAAATVKTRNFQCDCSHGGCPEFSTVRFAGAAKTTPRTPWNPAYMNPQDMQALGVHDASPIVIESEAGVIQALAREDDSLPTGAVSMTHAWGALVGDDPGEAGTFTGRLISLTTAAKPSTTCLGYRPSRSALTSQAPNVARWHAEPADGAESRNGGGVSPHVNRRSCGLVRMRRNLPQYGIDGARSQPRHLARRAQQRLPAPKAVSDKTSD